MGCCVFGQNVGAACRQTVDAECREGVSVLAKLLKLT